MGCLESSVTRLEATAAIAALKKLDVGPAMPAFFRASSADCGCEKFVTELPAQPASSFNVVTSREVLYATPFLFFQLSSDTEYSNGNRTATGWVYQFALNMVSVKIC